MQLSKAGSGIYLVANQVGTYCTYVDVSCIAMGQIYDEKNSFLLTYHPSFIVHQWML
jgi:hypothetical protein